MVEQTEIPINEEPDNIAGWVWKNLVPKSGQSTWVQGELLRCVEKFRWEAQNNGNVNWDAGFELIADYFEETLCTESAFSEEARRSIREDMMVLRNYRRPYTEEDLYDRLTAQVIAFCHLHPSLISMRPNPDLAR